MIKHMPCLCEVLDLNPGTTYPLLPSTAGYGPHSGDKNERITGGGGLMGAGSQAWL